MHMQEVDGLQTVKSNEAINDSTEDEVEFPDIDLIVEQSGGVGEVLGSGREKVAYKVGRDKVLIEYHGNTIDSREIAAAVTPEYLKAQYCMHKMFHILWPLNFLDVYAVGAQSILVELAPDDEDFVQAKKLNKLFTSIEGRSHVTSEVKEWVELKRAERLNHEEFQFIMDVLEKIGYVHAAKEEPFELAYPANTVLREGHPLLIEMMRPIITNEVGRAVPRIDVSKLANELFEAHKVGYLDDESFRIAILYAKNYYNNAVKASNVAQEKGSIVY